MPGRLWTFWRGTALVRYEPQSAACTAGRPGVSAWLPITVMVGAQIIMRLIAVIASIRQERAHARSSCAQMETAAKSDVVFCESHPGGATVLIIPSPPGLARLYQRQQPSPVSSTKCRSHDHSTRRHTPPQEPFHDLESLLVHATHDQLTACAFRLLDHRDDAQDVVQTVFLNVFRNWSCVGSLRYLRAAACLSVQGGDQRSSQLKRRAYRRRESLGVETIERGYVPDHFDDHAQDDLKHAWQVIDRAARRTPGK